MKKTLIALFAAVIAAGTATVAANAAATTADYVTLGEFTATASYPGSVATGLPEVTSGQLLTGKIIASPKADAERALNLFDGVSTTSAQPSTDTWVGIELDQAYQLTEIRYVPHPDEAAGPSGWFHVHASNDGIHWTQIVRMFQDSHGTDYHIFAPQTIEDERYTAAGYTTRTDESIHWLDDYGSYKMYRICMNHVGDVEFYGNPAPETDISTDELLAIRNIATPTWYPFITHIRKNAQVKNAVDGSLVGTIIGGGTIWNKAMYEKAFDNNNKTCFDPGVEGCEAWVGMMFDEPHALTEVRLLAKRGVPTDIVDGRFQASLDGHNWVDLFATTEADVNSKQEWLIKEVTDPKGYTYFRYLSVSENQSSLAEMLLFGAPAEAAEPFTVEPIIATQSMYTGPIVATADEKTVADMGEITGTPICGEFFYPWRDRDQDVEHAFDNNLSTYLGGVARLAGPQYWGGLKVDEPTVVGDVKFILSGAAPSTDTYFQGSNDGVNWVDLTVFTAADTVGDDGYITKTVTDTTAYEYFRLYIDGFYPVSNIGCSELNIFAAAAAPAETEAPETAAPETTAPVETTVSETTAPVETTAPAGTDEPTAPQTFDFGVVAAVTAIVSAAGYALTKKRK